MPHRSESERIAALDAALEALCGAFGPSGHEFQGVAERIAEMVRPLADELRFDALGNLICIRRGAPGAKRASPRWAGSSPPCSFTGRWCSPTECAG